MENSRPLMAFLMQRHFNLKSKHHFTVLKLIQMHNSTYSDQLGCTRRALPSQWLDLSPRMVWRAHLHIWQLFIWANRRTTTTFCWSCSSHLRYRISRHATSPKAGCVDQGVHHAGHLSALWSIVAANGINTGWDSHNNNRNTVMQPSDWTKYTHTHKTCLWF